MCVPKGETRYYPYYGLVQKVMDSSNGNGKMVTAMATVTEMVMVTMAMAETVAKENEI